MRILFLSHCVPYPPDKGDKVRAFHQIRWLSRRHEIHLLAIAKTEEDLQYGADLEEWCTDVEIFPLAKTSARARAAACLLTPGRPITHAYFWSPALASRVRSILREAPPDVTFAYTAAMGPYAELSRTAPGPCIDLVDIDSAKWTDYARSRAAPLKWIFGTEAERLRRYERSLSERFSALFVTTDRERESLEDLSLNSKPIVIRNGVDTEFFLLKTPDKSPNPKLVFTGQMNYYPNEDAVLSLCERIYPALQTQHRELSLDVVGRSPSRRIRDLSKSSGITVTGEVSDIRPYLQAAWVFVAPLRIARGVQNKILEAAAFELPIVCTSEVFKGLIDGGFKDGDHLLVADEDEEFVEAIGRLLAEPELRASLGVNAKQLLSTNYSWDENMRRLESHLEYCRTGPAVQLKQSRG